VALGLALESVEAPGKSGQTLEEGAERYRKTKM